ncbi:MAG: sigma 54-interacting transcriptional regulator [Peptostreptococcaceae bacterium]|nr:sigma 54-interacting transcriptional regulator [Peptostreptococcaceae bacterium]
MVNLLEENSLIKQRQKCGYIRIDEKGIVRYINDIIKEKYNNLDKDEIIGAHISEIFIGFDTGKEQLLNNIYPIEFCDEKVFAIPFDINEEGKENWVGILIAEFLVSDKLITKFINDTKLSCELREILEGSFDGILVTDVEGKVLYVNDSYERVAEIRREDIEGKYMRDLINPDWMPNSVAYVVVEKKKTVTVRQVVKSGRHIIVTGKPVFDKNHEIKMIVINARDITEIYNLNIELEKTKKTEKLFMDMIADLEKTETKEMPILAVSDKMKKVLSLAEKVANFSATVLILGESGVGKEEVAKFVHRNSLRKDGPFVTINCGAIPDNLLESELFGYDKGAFTGAMQTGKPGLLETANKGTVFLDEIGDIPLEFQVKLLRFLETKQVRKVGSVISKEVDVRVVAATNRNLLEMVSKGEFREDFYYRLNVITCMVPPLRDRVEDIMPLATYFLNRFNTRYDQEKILTHEVIRALEQHNWTGNVRELRNMMENMVILSNNEYLQTEDLPWNKSDHVNTEKGKVTTNFKNCTLSQGIELAEKELLLKTAKSCKSTREMAKILDVNQSTIVRKLKKYDIAVNETEQ